MLLALGALMASCQPPPALRDASEAVRPVSAAHERRVPAPVGEAEAAFVVYEAAAPGLTHVNLHDDENTAAEAARWAVRRYGGRLVEVRHTGAHNLAFRLGGWAYAFDPNRIFSDEGAAATLADLSEAEAASAEALAAARGFARALLEEIGLDTLGLVVTVHNNTEGNYSAQSYAPGGIYEGEAHAVYLAPGGDPDDFFFVTDEALYDALRGGRFSAVLQDNTGATDDGSLSVYAGRRGVPYVNVEAQHGHLGAQKAMLEHLHRARAGGVLRRGP